MSIDPAKKPTRRFVLGLDLDGVCADFYARMREVTAEWQGVDVDTLTPEVTFGPQEWGVRQPTDNDPGEYGRIHRFAVTQRGLFKNMEPIAGAPQSIRRLGTEGVRIRIITHRLFIRWFHEIAVAQTVRWLDHHGIPYWDLCLMRDKESVDADVYVEDSPRNIQSLREAGRDVIVFDNSTNLHLDDAPGGRAEAWDNAEDDPRALLRLPRRPGLRTSSCARQTPVLGHFLVRMCTAVLSAHVKAQALPHGCSRSPRPRWTPQRCENG